MKRWTWTGALLALAVFDVYCLLWHWSAVGGNIAASIIWGTPALGTHHVVMARRLRRHHAEATGRAQAQAEQLAAVAARVTELHDWHLKGKLPPDTLAP